MRHLIVTLMRKVNFPSLSDCSRCVKTLGNHYSFIITVTAAHCPAYLNFLFS